MAKNQDGYLSPIESRRISKENRRITDQYEKRRKRRNVPESEYTTQMKDPANAVEFDNLHTYFFTDTGVVKSVDGVSSLAHRRRVRLRQVCHQPVPDAAFAAPPGPDRRGCHPAEPRQ